MKNYYYFFDRSVLQPQRMRNVQLCTAPIQKDEANNPLFSEEFFSQPPKRWEARYDNAYPNVIYDPRDKLFRCYYTLCSRDDDSAGADRKERASRDYRPSPTRVVSLAYAQSADGVHWEKPDLGLVEFEGSRHNNLLFHYAHGTGVFLDAEEQDPAKRYKLVTKIDYPGPRSFMAVNFSADGVHWGTMLPWPRHNPPADSHNFPFRDKRDGLFKVITRTWRDGVRISSVCSSSDFINWSAPREILRGDGFEHQIYSMPVFWQNGLYLGLASIFHEGERTAADFDCVDCELTFSRAADHFDRAAPGRYVIPRGAGAYPDGAFDCGCIYAAAPFEHDGRILVYYMGGNGRHTNFRETSFARGFWQKDRYAYYTARTDETDSELWAGVFTALEGPLELLADVAEGGKLEVALFDAARRPIAGFGFEDCACTKREDGYTDITFGAHRLTELKTQVFSVVIRFCGAKLYAVRGGLALAKNFGIDAE